MSDFQLFLDHMNDASFLAHHYGRLFYGITFLWTALEGETFVLIAGLLAQKGYLTFGWLFLAAWLGSFAGDQIVFALGRHYGARILTSFPRIEPAAQKAIGWMERHAVGFILVYRFIYGVRNISSFAIGLSHLPWRKFAVWNAVAAFVWALVFTGLGYLFGDVLFHLNHGQESLAGNVRDVTLSILGLCVLGLLLRALVAYVQARRGRDRDV